MLGHRCRRGGVHMCVHAHGSQRLTSGLFLNHSANLLKFFFFHFIFICVCARARMRTGASVFHICLDMCRHRKRAPDPLELLHPLSTWSASGLPGIPAFTWVLADPSSLLASVHRYTESALPGSISRALCLKTVNAEAFPYRKSNEY